LLATEAQDIEKNYLLEVKEQDVTLGREKVKQLLLLEKN
jgi:hypothetical protein